MDCTLEIKLKVCEAVIQHEIRRHQKRYGGTTAEIRQNAYVSAITAIRNYPKKDYPFNRWICINIRRDLIDIYRKEIRRTPVADVVALKNLTVPPDHDFNPSAFMAEISEDARIVLSLLIDNCGKWNPGSGPSCRKRWLTLLKYQLRSANWTTSRITDAFSCIRTSLA